MPVRRSDPALAGAGFPHLRRRAIAVPRIRLCGALRLANVRCAGLLGGPGTMRAVLLISAQTLMKRMARQDAAQAVHPPRAVRPLAHRCCKESWGLIEPQAQPAARTPLMTC
jgi:hypothetical protein